MLIIWYFFEININKTVLFIVSLHRSNIVQVNKWLTSLINPFTKINIEVVNLIFEFASLLNRFNPLKLSSNLIKNSIQNMDRIHHKHQTSSVKSLSIKTIQTFHDLGAKLRKVHKTFAYTYQSLWVQSKISTTYWTLIPKTVYLFICNFLSFFFLIKKLDKYVTVPS